MQTKNRISALDSVYVLHNKKQEGAKIEILNEIPFICVAMVRCLLRKTLRLKIHSTLHQIFQKFPLFFQRKLQILITNSCVTDFFSLSLSF